MNDRTRDQKFEKLLKHKSNEITLPTVWIYNFTAIVLPENIEKILSQGLHQPVGGRTNKTSILTKFEGFFQSWRAHAEKLNLDIFKVTKVRSQLYLEFCKLVNCTTQNHSDTLKKFLENNPQILICPSDKSKNINVINKTEYLKKLDQVFTRDKFQPLKINPINTDLTKIRALINSFKPFLSNLDEFKIQPIETLKRGYGIIKNHKPGAPLRPIVSSRDTITSGAELYLKNLIAPINENCHFSVNSTLSFKTKFFEFSQSWRFDPEIHEVISYDCQSLYTSINIKRVIKYILDIIYADIETFFPSKTKTVKILKEVVTKNILVPPRETLQAFFMAILTQFSTFQASNGFFREIEGCSMGSKISPSIANIFCHMFETEIIKDEIENGSVQAYYRYVDDIFVVLKKGHKNRLLEKLNNFDKNLGFTIETMENSRLNFLDTTVVIKNKTLNLEHYRKPTATDCLINYKTGVSPKSYKMSAFTGELYRCHHSTTTDEARDRAIQISRNIYLKNQYPAHLLDQKIAEVQNRNFQKSDYAEKRIADLENPDFDNYTFSLQYTSQRCSNAATSIYKILNQYTPNYKLKIVFTTIKLDSVIHPLLKPQKSYYQNCNVCYKYTCDCAKSYRV